MMECKRCGLEATDDNLFCPCGKLRDREALRSVRLPGFVGVRHSTSPAIEQFWATGDPDIPGL